MTTPTSNLNQNDGTLDRSTIGSPADGRKLNGSGTQGSDINSGLSVGSVIPVTVKQVDHIAIEGSNKGNHLTPAGPAVLPAQPGPRGETGQAGA